MRHDAAFHDGLDEQDECDPTARGIIECLRMLAEEATVLHLEQTITALTRAMAVCAAEGSPQRGGATRFCGAPAGTLLH